MINPEFISKVKAPNLAILTPLPAYMFSFKYVYVEFIIKWNWDKGSNGLCALVVLGYGLKWGPGY